MADGVDKVFSSGRSSSANTISVERRGGVAIARITGDERGLGLFGVALLEPFERMIEAIEADPTLHAVVLTGTHPSRFLSHADVGWLQHEGAKVPPFPLALASMIISIAGFFARTRIGQLVARPTLLFGVTQLVRLHTALSRLQGSGKVYIAALNGSALGLGAEVAWACDMRVMTNHSDAFIGHPEILLGFAPGAGGTQRLTRLLGPQRTLRAMLEGRPFFASDALRLGIVDELAEPDKVLETALALASRFAGRQQSGIAAIKRAVHFGATEPLEHGLHRENTEFLAALPKGLPQELMLDYQYRTDRQKELPFFEPGAYADALRKGRLTDDIERVETEHYVRRTVDFLAGKSFCRAWYYVPCAPGRHPLIVMGHGIGATREMGLDPFARTFAKAGFAVLVFTHRNLGDSGGEDRQMISISSQIEDWHAAIDFGKQQPEVDSKRIAIWGSSFGGGNVIKIAAKRTDIVAAVAQCPFTDGGASASAVSFVDKLNMVPAVLLDLLEPLGIWRGRMIPIAGTQGKPALMTAKDALSGYASITPPGFRFRNEVHARVVPRLIMHRPGRLVSRIQIPIMFCISENDSVAPTGATLQYAETAPLGTIKMYRAGHFEFYTGETFKKLAGDQLEFLTELVGIGTEVAK